MKWFSREEALPALIFQRIVSLTQKSIMANCLELNFPSVILWSRYRGSVNLILIWVRFVLEYFLAESQAIVENISHALKPGGVLCLLDLDYNCLSHYQLPPMIENLLPRLMKRLEENFDFDVYAGRKLYSYLYDQGYQDIRVNLVAHHLFYGEIKAGDVYNWMKKIEVNADRFRDLFDEYPGGSDVFYA